MIKPRTTKLDISKLYERSYTYLLDNFSKFTMANKIKVALKMVEKYIDSNNLEEKDVTYITNIIGSFNRADRQLTEAERGRIGKVMGVLEENMRTGQPVTAD